MVSISNPPLIPFCHPSDIEVAIIGICIPARSPLVKELGLLLCKSCCHYRKVLSLERIAVQKNNSTSKVNSAKPRVNWGKNAHGVKTPGKLFSLPVKNYMMCDRMEHIYIENNVNI